MLLRLSFLSASEAAMLGEYVLALAKAAEKRTGFYFFFLYFWYVQMDFWGVDVLSFPHNLYEKGNSVV